MTELDQQRINERAADWVTRIQSGEVDPDDSGELRQWLSENDAHQRSFQRMLDVMARTDILADTSLSGGSADNFVHQPGRRYWLAAAASVIVALGAGIWFSQPAGQRIQTYTGERVLTTLDDGSSVHLNAESTLELRFTPTERLAFLHSGEVVFEVSKSDARPFLVRSGNLDIEVTGTSFQVSAYSEDRSVSVLEGSVLVRANADAATLQSSGTGAAVDAGYRVQMQDDAVSIPLTIDIRKAAAWREGWLYLDSQPLRELIGRLNRQYDGHIDLANAELGDTRVSVALQVGRQSETFAQLEKLLLIRFEEQAGQRHVVHADP